MHKEPSEAIGGNNQGERVAPGIARPSLITVALNPNHRVDLFRCPVIDGYDCSEVERFIREDARTYVAENLGEVYVRESPQDPTRIEGFYQIANSALRREEMDGHGDRLPAGTPTVPVFIIPWLGKDQSARKGLGAALVVDAAKRARAHGNVSWGLTLRAANAKLVGFYRELGFIPGTQSRKQLEAEKSSGPVKGRTYYMFAAYRSLITD